LVFFGLGGFFGGLVFGGGAVNEGPFLPPNGKEKVVRQGTMQGYSEAKRRSRSRPERQPSSRPKDRMKIRPSHKEGIESGGKGSAQTHFGGEWEYEK